MARGNAEVDSMDGIVENKTSPRLVAIEKAQAKLRQEYDVREERKRELEFLEKGGNPLDFNFGHAVSISLPSTSFTDKQAEPYVISEANGSFALAASPHADSIESSGRPDTNIADNLSLLDGENSNAEADKFAKRTNKRGNASLQEHNSPVEDSLMFHLGVKSQAYTRRNRSKSSRDNKSSVREARAQNNGIPHVSNSKPSSPDGNVLSKASTNDNKTDMEIDGVQTHHEIVDKVIIGNTSENNQNASSPREQVAKVEATTVDSNLVSPELTGNFRGDSYEKDKDDDVHATELKNPSDVKTEVIEKEHVDSGNACEGLPFQNVESKESSVAKKTLDDGVRENGVEASVTAIDEPNTTIRVKNEEELCDPRTDKNLEHECLNRNEEIISKPEIESDNTTLGDSSQSRNKANVIESNIEPSTSALPKLSTSTASVVQNSDANQLKLENKAREDEILKEARIIEAKMKRIALLSTSNISSDKRRKSHWDFVLEEMAWMANDFMQERLWKTAAAAHICHRIACSGKSKFEQQIIHRKQRIIARILVKAVKQFWRYADAIRTTGEAPDSQNGVCDSNLVKSKVNGETGKDQSMKLMDVENISSYPAIIQGYAVRFLNYEQKTSTPEAPNTPDRVNDVATLEKSCESELSEGSLSYTVLPGAMQAYREAVESQWLTYKKMANSVNQEDSVASPCDSLPDGPRKNEYEEEEGESGSYFIPGAFESANTSKYNYKKKKNFQQKYAGRSIINNNDFSYDPRLEGKPTNRVILYMGNNKRHSNTSNAGPIPTKRVRTAARQRFPYGAGPTGNFLSNNKTDVSSGDTNSLQDDQSSMHCGSQSRKNMEIESTADFEKQLPYDASDPSTKSKKKSKILGYSNHSDSGVLVTSEKGSMFDQRLHGDSMAAQQEQRFKVKKRLESQQYESNGHIGIYGQHASKKPKHLKQFTEPSQEGGPIPSPVTSQMSNMPNQTKFFKLLNRDRGRKSKTTKMAAGQLNSVGSWTTFEDQALIVFVHDMGPNWELVSDAINNTLQFKCIFRKPKDCKERHKALMEKSAGDGADSAEDSGSSQPYPSTLPGIPKGSAGLLFQRLQGPMEEDTLRDHFEKIISIGQKLHLYRSQKDTQDLKQISPVHNSHFAALSQTCPNNLGGGFLTPFDLVDSISTSPDVLALQYQGSQANGAAISNHQGSPSPVLSNAANTNTMLQGPSNIVIGNSLSPPSTSLTAPSRGDAQRYSMPRPVSLPDDQQKMPYNQILSGRNMGVDRGPHMIPGGNNMGMMGARATPMPRPGFQGMMSPGMPMVSSGSMLAGGGGPGGPGNVHPGAVTGPGNSMLRPRPGQNTEDNRQMMMQDIQMQVSQGNNGQSVPPFNAMSAPFSSTTPSLSSIPSYPTQSHPILGTPHGPHHLMNHSQQAYAMRIAKDRADRQLQQQRMMPQSQQPYASCSAMSSPHLINSSPLKQQTQPSSNNISNNNKQMPRNSQSNSQSLKQRPRQQVQQPRNQHQQKQIMKTLSGGPTMLMHQNLTVDPSQVSSEKKMMQPGLSFLSGTSNLNSNAPHKMYSQPPPPQTSKQILPLPSQSDTSLQRLMIQQNRKPISENQAIQGASLPRNTDNVSSAPSEASCDTSSATTKIQMSGTPKGNMVGNDSLVNSNKISINDGNGVGKQWQSQQQHRQGLQNSNNIYSRPTNSGPG